MSVDENMAIKLLYGSLPYPGHIVDYRIGDTCLYFQWMDVRYKLEYNRLNVFELLSGGCMAGSDRAFLIQELVRRKYVEMNKEIRHNRYLMFAHPSYEALGGIGDLKDSFNSFPKAIEAYEECEEDTVELYDRIEGKLLRIKHKNFRTKIYTETNYERGV